MSKYKGSISNTIGMKPKSSPFYMMLAKCSFIYCSGGNIKQYKGSISNTICKKPTSSPFYK